ncbi:MAG: radical SAM protein [Planctomycetota bacterium]|nr:radical SAM protein [Planctomycetota bacterium]
MTPYWEGEPHWPAELNTAVGERLVRCKQELVAFAADLPRRDLQVLLEATQAMSQTGNMVDLGHFLALDPAILGKLGPQYARRAREIGAEAEAEITDLLNQEQREELGKVGLCSLLSRVDYKGYPELLRRLNRLPGAEEATDHSDRFCPKPFDYAEIGPGGKTHLCCPVMVPTDAGDAQIGPTFMDVWNSESAQAIRASILDGSYSHCVEALCPDLQNGTLPKRDAVMDPDHREIMETGRTLLERGPRQITLNYDQSCNLACPMCRTHKIIVKGKMREEIEEVQAWATGEHLAGVVRMVITTSGDAFGSRVYNAFLREFDSSPYPNLRILILTNGLLLTPKTWDAVCNEIIDAVSVSIDAATAATYLENRGDDFAVLCENLEFIGGLRTSGELGHFGLHFTVQENNFTEMPAFVELARSVHADKVVFIQLVNGGTFSPDEYARRSVHGPAHPRHAEFLEVLREPCLGGPDVDLQVLAPLRAKALAAAPAPVPPTAPEPAGPCLELPAALDFAAGEHLEWLREGFSEVESSDHGAWAWSEGASSLLELSLDAERDLALTLDAMPFAYPGAPNQRVAVLLNGVPVGERSLSLERATYSVTLPAGRQRPGRNTIELRYAHARRPCDVARGSADERELAVCWYGIGVA